MALLNKFRTLLRLFCSANDLAKGTPTCTHEPYLMQGFLSFYMVCPKCGACGPEECSESAAMSAWVKMWRSKKLKKKSRQKRRRTKAKRGW